MSERLWFKGRFLSKHLLEVLQSAAYSPSESLDALVHGLGFAGSLQGLDCRWEDVKRAVLKLADLLNKEGIPYMITDGIATVLYGRLRTTLDIDLIVDCTRDQLERIIELVLEAGFEIGKEDVERAYEEKSRATGLLHELPAFRVDLSFADEYDRERIARSRSLEVDGTRVRVPRIEDLIPFQLRYGRMEDALFLASKYRDLIDWKAVEGWVEKLRIEPLYRDFVERLE